MIQLMDRVEKLYQLLTSMEKSIMRNPPQVYDCRDSGKLEIIHLVKDILEDHKL